MLYQAILLFAICISSITTDTNYRLNVPFKPDSYEIIITPYFDTGDGNAFTFDGEVKINFKTESTSSQIKLHSEDLNYTSADITVSSGNQIIALRATDPLQFDKNYTFAFINLQSDLQIGVPYTLRIVYRGVIREDLNGFYRNYYIENGEKKWLGATQMEPTHARKAFPCFDEPELKATFTLTIDRPERFKPSLANTKLQSTTPLSNGYVRETFYPTPRMSTYLVAFLVSEFEAAEYTNNDTREFGVFTRPEAANQSNYAFNFGHKVVDALGAYFDIDFYSTDANLKLDHVALPDFRAGAMENWGLIKYRESLLLYVPEESTPYYKYRVAQIVAHETTHMWFGNLVTCHWWSNTWLNEGFANYFQDYMTSLIEPDLGAGDMLVTGSVWSAYDADNTAASPAITNNNVNSPAEISAHFGTITYQKAGSVIRMMHHLLGDEAFVIGLKSYLKTNQFQASYPELLYQAFDEAANITNALKAYSNERIADIMGSWITQAGHPVLDVNIDYETDTVTLTQKRFYINESEESNEIYKIPITYTTQASPNFDNLKPAFIMESQEHSLKIENLNHSWVIFNLQETGLYRVNYDDRTWEHIASALKSNEREKIHYLNRAKIVNDLFAFYYSDEVSFEQLKNVISFLDEETDYSVWNAAIRGLDKLWHSYLGTEVLIEIENYATKLTSSIINKLGYEEKQSEDTVALRNRMQVLDLACKVGHTGCIEHAVQIFRDFKVNGTRIPPSLRPVAYCYGLRNGDDEDYELLWQRMATTNVANEARIIGEVLGCTKSDQKLKKYLVAMMEQESPIRTQDLTVPLVSVLSNYENVDLVINELQTNYNLWDTIYPSMDSVLSTIASVLHTEDEFSKFENWLSSCTKCSESAVTAARTSITQAKASASWANAHKAEILKSLRSDSVAIFLSRATLLFSLTAAFFLIF